MQGEYYHIYNRGVDKRAIFGDIFDVLRFYQSMEEFNVIEPIGSIYENRFNKKDKTKLGRETSKSGKLVDIVAYCLNPNHFHFILIPLVENGISEFMKRLLGGYTKFFNTKYKRSGALFQGLFKDVHIDTDEYLMYVSAYVNLNNRVHKPLGRETSKFKLMKSSWNEYMNTKIIKDKKGDNKLSGNPNDICQKDIILERFDDIRDYKKFAESALQSILKRRYEMDTLE